MSLALDGLPLGLQLIAGQSGDVDLFRAALWRESIFGKQS
jgi:Asp-tRNA(Asn)/Glu-tRNA(Gln) amidotransferase A subunit family amidase